MEGGDKLKWLLESDWQEWELKSDPFIVWWLPIQKRRGMGSF
jgi:hypothetical protein